MRTVTSVLALSLIVGCNNSAHASRRYAGFDVSSHDDPNLAFRYSAGDATAASPIVITAIGRKVTAKDRPLFSDLRAHWLSSHVGEELRFVAFGSAQCDFHLDENPPFCDLVYFVDENTKREVVFYFYAGNWPFE